MKGEDFAVDFGFVADVRLRGVISQYHGEAIRAFDYGLYAATVFLSGAALEGSITWALEKHRGSLPPESRKWGLAKLLDEAGQENLVGDAARGAAWAVRDFRNLIHPYNVIGRSTHADLALAAGALSAVLEITRSVRGRLSAEEAPAKQVPPAPTFDADRQRRLLNFAWLLPGKVSGCRGPQSGQDLDVLRDLGVRAIVRLAAVDEAGVTAAEIEAAGLRDCHEPVKDFAAPRLEQVERAVAFIRSELQAGNTVAVSCGAGYGRTSTLLAAWLISEGQPTDQALQHVKEACARSPETAEQIETLRLFERSRRR